ncbi:PP2C family serine/threonine-protein phosphatase [Evansella sp. AB-rgal1]|uniref:PP2C family serine/threonine-protein phosphatase n=1 Tax=Evansella sp. AB-rgal1 TaxID=3242696 RepID=UPI00359CCBD7
MIENHHLNGAIVSTYQTAKKGNWCSGDSVFTVSTEEYVLIAVADGLGSGEEALEASSAAIEEIKSHHHLDVSTIMKMCNQVLTSKRGTVLGVLKIYLAEKEMEYCNVGNIGCIFYTPSGKLDRPIPSRGYLSGKKQVFRIQRTSFEKGMTFLLYSDGLKFSPSFHTHFVELSSPEVAISQLTDEMQDTNDDTTIVIGKII